MIKSVEYLTGFLMSFINQCKKYITFIKLKYASNTNYKDEDVYALALCLAIVKTNHIDEDISLQALRKRALFFKNFEINALTTYFKMLENEHYSFKHSFLHNRSIELIKLKINTTFSTSIDGRKSLLTKKDLKITNKDGAQVKFNITDDGLLQLSEIIKGNEVFKRNYKFPNIDEFSDFTKNLEDNIEIDDEVIKMVFI